MSRFRKIDLRIHADEKYRRLTPSQACGQTLWWHMIAGEQTGIIPGIYRIGEAAFAEQLKWSLKGFRESFAELFREGLVKADWCARLVWVPNAIKYNPPANPNIVRSWKDAWHELPECELKIEAYQRLKAFVEPLGKGFRESFAELFGESGAGAGAGAGAGNTPLTPRGGGNGKLHQNKRRRKHLTAAELQAEDEAKEKEANP